MDVEAMFHLQTEPPVLDKEYLAIASYVMPTGQRAGFEEALREDTFSFTAGSAAAVGE